MISVFIWAGKTPRARRTTLQRRNKDGGLSLPNLLFYYWAANIQKLRLWHSSSDADWCLMEALSCHATSLSALLCAPLASCPSKYTSNPIVISSLKIWKQFRQHFKLSSPSPHSPILNNHLFTPSKFDTTFALWKRKGIVVFSNLYVDGTFATFEDIRNKFDLPHSSLFRYLQARDCARTHFASFPLLTANSLMDDILSLNKLSGSIAVLYDLIISAGTSPLTGAVGKWERELGLDLTDEWWEIAFKRVNSTSSCARLTLIQFKVLHRIHFTKAKLSKLFPGSSDICDRCSSSIADHTHMFYSCSKLAAFWSVFFDTVSKALNISLSPSPHIAIFGVPEDLTMLTRNQSDVIAFASLIAVDVYCFSGKTQTHPPHLHGLKICCLFSI